MRPAAVLLICLLLAACSGDTTGADDPRTAVDTYLAAMNNNDEAALRNVLAEPQRDLAKTHLSDRGGRALAAVESVDITQDFGPMYANAHVQGTLADGSRYDERVTVSKIDDRWYVGIQGPIRVPPDGKPTGAVTR